MKNFVHREKKKERKREILNFNKKTERDGEKI
jgi:hypothetical protein